METALSGVRILDLTRYLAGPFASQLLSDLGAEVIKIEPPHARKENISDYIFKGEDAYFISTGRGKKGLCLNLRLQKGREIFHSLVRKSDVVFENFRLGATKSKFGFDYETLKGVNPRIIYCSITGFGSSGPYCYRPAYDVTIQAMGGGMSITGEPGGAPVRAGAPIGDVGGGIIAVQGILAALYARERMGEGQRVEVSLLGAQLYILTYEANHYLLSGKIPGPLENSGHRFIPAYGVFGTKDSYIAVATVPEESVFRLFKAVGRGDLVTDPRFDSIPKRLENKSQLASIFREVFPAKTTEEWLDILNREDVPCSPVNNFRDVFADPQVLQQDMVATIDWEGEQLKQVGNPIRLSATPEGMRNTYLPPPHVGQHTDEVLSQVLGYSEEEIRQLRDEGVVY